VVARVAAFASAGHLAQQTRADAGSPFLGGIAAQWSWIASTLHLGPLLFWARAGQYGRRHHRHRPTTKAVSFDEEKTEGIAIMLTVDVSLSMRIQDFYISGIPVNRLTAAKRVMQDFIAGRATDRIGITAFAGAPYVPCPLTLDHDWLQTNIERVQTGVMEDGTAIGSGLAAAARRLDDQKVPSKVIILLTDGANNSGKLSPQDAAKLAVTLGIKIYTIAIGTPGVHMIPLEDGRIITSGRQEFDEQTLREVARLGSGQFYMAQDLSALAKIFKTIDDLEKVEIKRKTYIEVSELFHWFVAIAVGLLLLALLLNQTLLRTAPSPAST
jgi:Ca-activated chloride channel family protein